MDMEISDSSDESVNRNRQNKRSRLLSTSSDEDFVHARNEGESLINEEYESTTEEEDSDSDSLSEEDDEDTEWQQIRNPVINEKQISPQKTPTDLAARYKRRNQYVYWYIATTGN
ncbi:hypothetical protein M0804_007846 [Polistes exclamans]|nr:hypothetical protein M0804_007846 [Polistes exclamans]